MRFAPSVARYEATTATRRWSQFESSTGNSNTFRELNDIGYESPGLVRAVQSSRVRDRKRNGCTGWDESVAFKPNKEKQS